MAVRQPRRTHDRLACGIDHDKLAAAPGGYEHPAAVLRHDHAHRSQPIVGHLDRLDDARRSRVDNFHAIPVLARHVCARAIGHNALERGRAHVVNCAMMAADVTIDHPG